VTLRTDHVAGGIAVVAGLLLFLISADLPIGSLSFPGAGMWPKLICALMVALGLLLLARGSGSTPLAVLDWGDLRHAAIVAGATAIAIALYPALGFIVSMSLLLIGLALLERRKPLFAAIYGICSSVAVYALFTMLLKAPLERGLIGF
jgi:hypothetical protein